MCKDTNLFTLKIIDFIHFPYLFRGMSFRIGICVPMAVTGEDVPLEAWLSMDGKKSSWKDIKNGAGAESAGIVEAGSLEELDSDSTKNVFFDREKG